MCPLPNKLNTYVTYNLTKNSIMNLSDLQLLHLKKTIIVRYLQMYWPFDILVIISIFFVCQQFSHKKTFQFFIKSISLCLNQAMRPNLNIGLNLIFNLTFAETFGFVKKNIRTFNSKWIIKKNVVWRLSLVTCHLPNFYFAYCICFAIDFTHFDQEKNRKKSRTKTISCNVI